MARIRTVKPDFWTDEKVVELSMAARLTVIGSLNFADDNGNLERSAKKLKMQIFPADSIDCEPLIQEVIAQGMFNEYSVNGKNYLHIKGFCKHQVINRPSKSNIPAPSFSEESDATQAALTEPSLTEGKGKEGKGKEEDKDKTPHTPQGGLPAVSKKREGKPTIEFKTFIANCRESGEKPIPSGDPIYDYAEEAGICDDWLALQWSEFKARYSAGSKRYKDWREVYRKSVRGNWFKLWFIREDNTCGLTTQGMQAKQVLDGKAAK